MHSTIIMVYIGVNSKLTLHRADTVFMVLSLFSHLVLEEVYIFHCLIDRYIDIVYGEQILALGSAH